MADLAWMELANCLHASVDAFFPEVGENASGAKRICNGDAQRPPCKVRSQCLQFALDNDIYFGVWGGVSERDRRAMRGRRAS